ncbi:hypothetical protein RvY_00185 [Ramazzottius varieornatus]|uniref:DH domain-containing protein n=1 Tax=Ramazzottius varieornatus TaxID=947166 RepID=A0A1D1UMD2_RAMVA|nr:hypothetical protein RvY_00185 [Ramazzottius varieornatus]
MEGEHHSANGPLCRFVFLEDGLHTALMAEAVANLKGRLLQKEEKKHWLALAERGEIPVGDRLVLIAADFSDAFFQKLRSKLKTPSARLSMIGPPVLLQCAGRDEKIPKTVRPLYNNLMHGVVVIFSGFDEASALAELSDMVHYMGGKVTDKFHQTGTLKPTHLVARWLLSDKYQSAFNFGSCHIVKEEWIKVCWSRRDEMHLDKKKTQLTQDKDFLKQFRLKPFHGLKICLIGFDDSEKISIKELVQQNDGQVVDTIDHNTTHIVVEEKKDSEVQQTTEVHDTMRDGKNVKELYVTITLNGGEKASIVLEAGKQSLVRSDWFWTCLKLDHYANPDAFSLLDPSRLASRFIPLKDEQSSGSRGRSRLSAVAEFDSPSSGCSGPPSNNSSFDILGSRLHFGKLSARSSSNLASLVAPVISKRQHTVLEMRDTEEKYVKSLGDILKLCDNATNNIEGGSYLDEDAGSRLQEHMKGIREMIVIHRSVRGELTELTSHWTEGAPVGSIFLRCGRSLEELYPPFVNNHDKIRKFISDCEKRFPRFRAFLKLAEKDPLYDRQHLMDLLTRPVQRLPSVKLLLKDLRKRTEDGNRDAHELDKAILEIERVLHLINDGKRNTEVQEMLNGIENIPHDLLSSSATSGYIAHLDCVELASHQFHEKYACVTLILFNDALEVAKKRSQAKKSQDENGAKKPHKHLQFLPLIRLKEIASIHDEEQVKGVFVLKLLVEASHENTSEHSYKFACVPEYCELKAKFLSQLATQVSSSTCQSTEVKKAYADDFDIKSSDVPKNEWEKIGRKVRREVSIRFSTQGLKSSGQKLKRAVSTAFLTPAKLLDGERAEAEQDHSSPMKLFRR